MYLPPTVLDYRSRAIPLTRVVCDWLPRDTTYGQRHYTNVQDGFGVSLICSRRAQFAVVCEM